MKKILIADSGSTKTDWVKLTYEDKIPVVSETFVCSGLNPVILDSADIEKELTRVCGSLGKNFDSIRFYGAGLGSRQMIGKMEDSLANSFECSSIEARSDMAGAAKAVLGNLPGVACIMGTGSNSCHYDGDVIDRPSVSLGYILDDNGGGVSFGRRLLADVFKNHAPKEICDEFHREYHLSAADVIDNIYRRPGANKWIAGFMPFVIAHRNHPYMATMIDSQLKLFLDREFESYSDDELKEQGIGFVGSVANLLSQDIINNLRGRDWKLRGIVQKPLELLAAQCL